MSSCSDDKRKGTRPADSKSSTAAKEVAPTTLEEAHRQLEILLSKEELAKIDAMKSEDEMVKYHLELGMGLRNEWGLWQNSPLYEHLHKLGFTHPDDMSGVILETFWCKRHGKDFRLEERAAHYAAYWKSAADPPKTAKDPEDGSSIVWFYSFLDRIEKNNRYIHVGKSEKTGRWLAYEYDKGVYVPATELQKRISDSEKEKVTPKTDEGE
jgi:hypothetical protein